MLFKYCANYYRVGICRPVRVRRYFRVFFSRKSEITEGGEIPFCFFKSIFHSNKKLLLLLKKKFDILYLWFYHIIFFKACLYNILAYSNSEDIFSLRRLRHRPHPTQHPQDRQRDSQCAEFRCHLCRGHGSYPMRPHCSFDPEVRKEEGESGVTMVVLDS